VESSPLRLGNTKDHTVPPRQTCLDRYRQGATTTPGKSPRGGSQRIPSQTRRRRPSDKQRRQGCAELRLYCQRWNSLQIGPDGLLTIFLAANHGQPARERVVCPAAIRRELIRDTHQQAHAGVQRVLTKLQLRWYWPNMERDVRRRVRQCETC